MRHGNIIVWRDGDKVTILSGLQTQSLKERLCGLLVLAPLKPEQALWLTPCNSIHTAAMKYDLDLIYLDRNNAICKLVEDIPPWRMSGSLKAKVTIELPAGSIKQFNIQHGDRCEWQD